ncbi:MAG: hypothetical protein WA162_04185 [Thermodesulfobacteriota bacterium]
MKDEKRGRDNKARTILKSKTPAVKASRKGGKHGLSATEGKRAIPTQTKSSVRDDHRKLLGRVKKRFSDNLDKSDEKEDKFVKIKTDTLLDIMKGERMAWGLIDEDSDECLGEAVSFAEEMERLTAPPGADAALDGKEEV